MTNRFTPEEFEAILSVDDDDELAFQKGDTVYFSVNLVESVSFDGSDPYDSIMVCFVEKSFWDEHKEVPDEQFTETFEALGIELPSYLEEDLENVFIVFDSHVSRNNVIKDLEALGFVFSQEVTDFLDTDDD